jgi:hypothetical protein
MPRLRRIHTRDFNQAIDIVHTHDLRLSARLARFGIACFKRHWQGRGYSDIRQPRDSGRMQSDNYSMQ